MVSEATGTELSDADVKRRSGSQLKANGVWEGSCRPTNTPRSPAKIFLATDREDLAVDGARRRMSLHIQYPEAVVGLFDILGTQVAHVLGYSDSRTGQQIANTLGVPLSVVARPANAPGAARATTIDASLLRERLKQTPNVILQGPPGTGKTSLALEFVRETVSGSDWTVDECRFGRLLEDAGGSMAGLLSAASMKEAPAVWELVQLHPGYSYDDLVRRLVPKSDGSSLRFEAQDCLLPQLCQIAEAIGPERPVVLVLDEINRCDFAATMGEFIFAMDPSWRGKLVRLQYQGEGLQTTVRMPPNLLVVGTMNTADRSIAMVDYAVRRRFRFIDVPANPSVVEAWYASAPDAGALAQSLLEACNAGLPERIHVGHSEFLVDPNPSDSWADRFARQIAYHALPLLEQYEREGLRSAGPISWRSIEMDVSEPRAAAKLLGDELRAALPSGT